MPDDRTDLQPELSPDDLDEGLRERLRNARDGRTELTRGELLELADALARQRQDLAGALADLKRREGEATAMRDALERASREASKELDERDTRLGALAQELMVERARLERRAREVAAAELKLPARGGHAEAAATSVSSAVAAPAAAGRLRPAEHGHLESFEGVVKDLRGRLERLEASVAARVRSAAEDAREAAAHRREDRFGRAVEALEELVRMLRSSGSRLAGDEHAHRPPQAEPAGSPAAALPVVAPAVTEQETPRPQAPADTGDGATAPAPCEGSSDDAAVVAVDGHLLFLATNAGYRLLEQAGPPPAPGNVLELDELRSQVPGGDRLLGEELRGARARVTGRRASPLPADRRPCVACVLDGHVRARPAADAA